MKNLLEFDDWDSVTDYESDETSVSLYCGNIKLAELKYPKFTQSDLGFFKQKTYENT